MFRNKSSHSSHLLSCIALFSLAGGMVANALSPEWWSMGDSPVIDPQATADNHAVANIGQAKWVAKKALEALRAKAPYIAEQIERDLVGAGKPIPTWNVPTTQPAIDQQRAVFVIGQLKAISAPFYVHLQRAVPSWLTNERVLNGMPATGSFYPWTANTLDDANYSPATIGQLKAVFSLRFESLAAAIGEDTDSDGLADGWERYYFGGLAQNGADDPDGDGLTNATEFSILSDPQNPDTDGDGMGDGYEKYYQLEVNAPVNMPAPGPKTGPDDDKDGDGETNKEEWEAGSIPISAGEQPKFTYPPPSLKWFGVSGRVYFIQWTNNLVTWNTVPIEQVGTNHEITFFPTTGFFFRLKIYYTIEDTDWDGIPDWREIEQLGTDPDNLDSDGDGLTDGEEVSLGTNPLVPNQTNFSAGSLMVISPLR